MRRVVAARYGVFQQIDVIEAGDGDAPRHGPAAALAFEQGAHRQTFAREETRVEIGMGLHQPHQRIGALAEAARPLR